MYRRRIHLKKKKKEKNKVERDVFFLTANYITSCSNLPWFSLPRSITHLSILIVYPKYYLIRKGISEKILISGIKKNSDLKTQLHQFYITFFSPEIFLISKCKCSFGVFFLFFLFFFFCLPIFSISFFVTKFDKSNN